MNIDRLSIILPIHNERASLEKVISSWHHALSKISDCEFQFLACEDGSTDGTQELIAQLAQLYPVVNLSVSYRRGYGKAVLDGISSSTGDYLLCIDSDGQCHPDNFALFWLNRKNADFVIGWRKPRHDPHIRLLYSKMFFGLHKLLFSHSLHDPSCPFVLGRREAYQDLQPYLGFLKEGFWWGFVGACVKKQKSFIEIIIKHEKRFSGNTQVYHLKKMPSIIFRNIIGLFKLRLLKAEL